jgi:hypothetical protein
MTHTAFLSNRTSSVYSLYSDDTICDMLTLAGLHTPQLQYYIFLVMFQKISCSCWITNATISFLSMAYLEIQMAGGRMYVTWTRKWSRFVQNYCWYFTADFFLSHRRKQVTSCCVIVLLNVHHIRKHSV